jgi:hypothetical protein
MQPVATLALASAPAPAAADGEPEDDCAAAATTPAASNAATSASLWIMIDMCFPSPSATQRRSSVLVEKFPGRLQRPDGIEALVASALEAHETLG